MSHKKSRFYMYDRERDNESINCCQLDVHKHLIKERNASVKTTIPLHGKRSSTDIFCLFVFVAAVIAWIVISTVVFGKRSPNKFLAVTDSNNRQCGFDKGVEDRPYLFFFDITKCLASRNNIFFCDAKQVCVSECPTINFSTSYYLQNVSPLAHIKEKLICIDEFNKELQINSYEDVKNAIKAGYCTEWYLESEPVARLCLPRYLPGKPHSGANLLVDFPDGTNIELRGLSSSLIKSAIHKLRGQNDFIYGIGEALVKWWKWLIAFACLSMIICFVFIIIMRWISGIIVWMSLFGLIGLLVFSSFYTWTKYSEAIGEKKVLKSTKVVTFSNLRKNLDLMEDDLVKDEIIWLALFILSVLALIVIIIILLFLRNRIKLAIQLIKEGSKAISNSWSSLFFPIFPMILQLGIFAQGALFFCYLLGDRISVFQVSGLNESHCTCRNGYKDNDICDIDTFKSNCYDIDGNQCLTASCSFSKKESENVTIYLQLYNLFMFFWCWFFASGFGQISLAMTFATYYWTTEKRKLPFFVVGTSVLKVLRYNLGTVAFGSLLLAFLSWIRVLVNMLYRMVYNSDRPIMKYIKCCCGFILNLLHKLLSLLTNNAYIMCAMKGTNYCASAKQALNLILLNIVRASVLDGVITFLFFLMKLLITLSMGMIAYVFFTSSILIPYIDIDEDYQIYYSFGPVLIVCLATFIISSLTFGVYSTAVDTIFLCALEDLEKNNGTSEKPYVMSKSLIKIFKVKNKRPSNVS